MKSNIKTPAQTLEYWKDCFFKSLLGKDFQESNLRQKLNDKILTLTLLSIKLT